MHPIPKIKPSGVSKHFQNKRLKKVVPNSKVLSETSSGLLANLSKKSCSKYKYIKARILALSKSTEKIKFPLLPKNTIDFIDDEDEEVNEVIFKAMNSPPNETTNCIPSTSKDMVVSEEESSEQLSLNNQKHESGCNRSQEDMDSKMFINSHLLIFKKRRKEMIVALYGTHRTILTKNIDRQLNWNHALDSLHYIHSTDGTHNFLNKKKIPDQIYFVINDDKIIGAGACVSITEAFKVQDTSVGITPQETFPAKCGILSLWVDKPFRRKGVASQILESVRRFYSTDTLLTRDQIAFSSSITPEGKLFAEKYFRQKDYLVFL